MSSDEHCRSEAGKNEKNTEIISKKVRPDRATQIGRSLGRKRAVLNEQIISVLLPANERGPLAAGRRHTGQRALDAALDGSPRFAAIRTVQCSGSVTVGSTPAKAIRVLSQ